MNVLIVVMWFSFLTICRTRRPPGVGDAPGTTRKTPAGVLRARAPALDLLNKFSTAMAKLPAGTLTPAEMRAYIDREILTIPVTHSAIVQDDARAGTAAENGAGTENTVENDDTYGANALASEADDLLAWILASLPEAELQALTAESNQVVAALHLTTHIEDLAGESITLAALLNP